MIRFFTPYLLFSLVLSLCSAMAQAQQPYYKKYTQENGFPSTVVYSMVQDKQHFLWFSTENGVCRFDGRRMKHFTPANSSFDLGIFQLLCDSRNRVWGVSIFSAPCYYSNNRFYTVPKKMQQLLRSTRWMLEDSKGILYFLSRDGYIVRWRGDDNYTVLNLKDISIISGAVINDTTLVVSGGSDILAITNFKTIKKLPIQGYAHEPNRFYKLKENLVIGFASDGIYQYTPAGHKMILKHQDAYSSISYSMHTLNDSTIWLATRGGIDVYRYRDSSLRFIEKKLPGKSVLAMHKDHSNNYWIAASNDAVYFFNAVPNKYYTFTGREANINYVSFTGNTGHLFSKNGDHYLMEGDSISFTGNITDKTPTYTYIKAIPASGNTMVIQYRGGAMAVMGKSKFSTIDAAHIPAANNYYYRQDGKFFAGIITGPNSADVWEVSDTGAKKIVSYNVTSALYGIDKHFCFDHSSRCWSSAGDTLVCMEPVACGKSTITKYPTHGIFIADICCDGDNNVWVATKGAGVYCITSQKQLIAYNTEHGLATNFCSSLYVDADGAVWVCSQNGLNKIYKNKAGKYTIKAFTKDNLLPVSVVNCVYKKGGTVYVGTPAGLFVFEDVETGNVPVNCYITGVSAGGRSLPLQNNYTFEYGKSVNIGFSTIDYNQSTTPVFHYRLKGAEEHWNTTTAAQVEYGQLKPGDYTFSVYPGRYPLQSASVHIRVLTPFWQQSWFILCVVALLLLTGFATSYIIIRVRHRTAVQQRRMLESDLKSLRAQINPHFIFNALNSIQDFILDQQPRIANHYLTRFARLMRMIVDNSKKEWISLSDEKYFLQLYLELEKLRLGDTFSFNIITDASIDTAMVHIPPMLIQPLAENSIKHGLSGKDGVKHLEIHFSLHDNFVYCRIKDNGIGRERAQSVAAKNAPRQSMGIDNINERLQLLYTKQQFKKDPVVITDLYDGAAPAGTLVEVFIPYFIDN